MQQHPPTRAPRGFIRRNLVAVVGVGVVAVAGLAWLAFGYFGIHTAFIDDEVDEAGPVFASGVTADAPATDDAGAGTAPATDADADADPGAGAGTDGTTDPPATDAGPTPAAGEDTDEQTGGEIVTLAGGTFSGLGRYSGSGDALVLNDGSEQRFLRFENFETSNGPDLEVYLAVGGDVDAGFVTLGDLKGNIGSQNYEIPADVDLGEFDTVLIWCVRFGVGFAEAQLVPMA